MAPEQLLRQPVDHRADLFAYGVTAYELLTGRKPFPGETPDEILRKQLDRTDFLAPRDLNPDSPLPSRKSYCGAWSWNRNVVIRSLGSWCGN